MGVEEANVTTARENGGPTSEISKDDRSSSSPPKPEVPEELAPKMLEEIITPSVLAAIAKGYKDGMTCTSFHAELGTKPGDNYMSVMYSVDMKLENPKTKEKDTLKIMLKTMPRNSVRAEMINEMKAFTKETAMYQKVFPMFTQFQKEKGIPISLQVEAWPKCYAAYVDGSRDYLAMENLRVEGFKMANRKTGLDFNHSSLVLRNMARYHALSYAKFGGSREAILEAFPMLVGQSSSKSENQDMHQQFFAGSIKKQADILKAIGEDLAASRLEKISSGMDFFSVLENIVEKNVEVAVITHGDSWVNNMMFAYEDEDSESRFPITFKYVDFQICAASSRLVDIFLFLLSSAKLEVLQKYEQDLLMIYYTEFTNFAQTLGVDTKEKGLTWEKFLEEGDRHRFYGVCMTLVFGPMMVAESADIPDMEAMSEEEFKDLDGAMATFTKGLAKSSAMQKAKLIALEHLPRCKGFEEYL